jgi:NADH-quinone oxidoreductase subunit A
MEFLAESYLRQYVPAAIYALIVVVTGGGLLGLARFLGPRRAAPGKTETYECGMPLLGDARQKFSVRFYLVAILFVLFDIETVFLIPWAVIYRDLLPHVGFLIVAEMLVFLGVLALGFVYAWKRGGLDWE